MPPHADAIADCVLNAFHALPAKLKPRSLADGRKEWVPLAGIVLSRASRDASASPSNRPPNASHSLADSTGLFCAALATGMKCLPQNKLAQAKGAVLHDWHAEVLAIRAFNRFLVDSCADLARKGFKSCDTGAWVQWRRGRADGPDDKTSIREEGGEQEGVFQPPFELSDGVDIHMYCSEAPCGDASMELIMDQQDDSTPWVSTTGDGDMLGRGHFDQLGIVRRKPARPDAPTTLSKSCTDKLAMKQCTGLLSGLTSTLIWPKGVYLRSLVLPESQCVRKAVDRAFGAKGRMKAVFDMDAAKRRKWERGGNTFTPFEVMTTKREFEFSKRSSPNPVPSNLSALVIPQKQEILINGVLQGRKQFEAKGASCVSRKGMWKAVLDVSALDGMGGFVDDVGGKMYGEMKASRLLEVRERVKADVRELALKGWKRNVGDEEWTVDGC